MAYLQVTFLQFTYPLLGRLHIIYTSFSPPCSGISHILVSSLQCKFHFQSFTECLYSASLENSDPDTHCLDLVIVQTLMKASITCSILYVLYLKNSIPWMIPMCSVSMWSTALSGFVPILGNVLLVFLFFCFFPREHLH